MGIAADNSRGLGKRLLKGLVAIVALALVLYLLLPLFGLKIARVSREPVALSGSTIESRRAAPSGRSQAAERPVNVIVFVADGLGFAHLSAARSALHGMGSDTVWDRFAITGWHQPHSATGFLVDSAASATALATGVPTHNDRVGVDIDDEPLDNLFERATNLGYRTGVVTDSYIWDATPAAFVTHATSRDDAASILRQLADSDLEILVGELEDVGEGEVPEKEPTLAMLEERFRLFGANGRTMDEFLRTGGAGGPVAAIFDEDQVTDLSSTPTLPQLLPVALERLSSDQRPFLLLIESEETDSASHEADLERLLNGLRVIEATLELVLDFAEVDGETLVLFTSDHETGGLALSIADSTNKSLEALWSTVNHSGVVVPVLASGPGSEVFDGMHATWEIGRLLHDMLGAPTAGAALPAEAD